MAAESYRPDWNKDSQANGEAPIRFDAFPVKDKPSRTVLNPREDIDVLFEFSKAFA
jgi:hypothetical protein